MAESGHPPAGEASFERKFVMRKTFESNSDAGQRGSIPALAGAFRAPRGLSLIEVLVAIFVVTVGLLGVVTLLPLSQKDASQGAIQDQVALVGKSAWRDFLVRGMNRPAVWVYDNGQSVYGPKQSDPSYESIRWWDQDGPLPATHQGLPTPILLDPWLVPRLSVVPTLQNRHFGFGNLTTNIPRVTLWDMNKRGVLPELADKLFTFSDDLAFPITCECGRTASTIVHSRRLQENFRRPVLLDGDADSGVGCPSTQPGPRDLSVFR